MILGNHDRGRDQSGAILEQQLSLLGSDHCAWGCKTWPELPLSIIGARPCSAGGGFHLSKAVKAVYGPVSLEDSIDRIVNAAAAVPADQPLIVMAHSGPSGLGSDPSSPCGRDWKTPSIDWGDQDLAVALDRMAQRRHADLVVFGHMHHELKAALDCVAACCRIGAVRRIATVRQFPGVTAMVSFCCIFPGGVSRCSAYSASLVSA